MLREALFEMCRLYMNIAEIALDHPPSLSLSNGQMWKKVLQAILGHFLLLI